MQIIEVIAPQMITLFKIEKSRSFYISQSTIPTQRTAISHHIKIIVAANRAIVFSILPISQYPIAKLTTTKAYVLGKGLEE